MSLKKVSFILSTKACLFVLSACAVGPLVSNETARSVGKNNHEISGAISNASHALKWNYGVTDDLDIGLQLETLSTGARLKYAFLNNQTAGWSFASAIGAGSSTDGSHFYADLMSSYLNNKWEPYGSLRLVQVKRNEFNISSTDENIVFDLPETSYSYAQIVIGSRYLFSEDWFFSLELSSPFSFTDGLSFSESVIVSSGAGYRF